MDGEFNFEASNKTVKEVLFANNKFKVPRYQRPYAWEEDQVAEFWGDLTTNKEPYFLGSLIFNYEEHSETGFIDIIDGQQRLLTITIFSAVLRDIAKNIDIKFSELIQRKHIVIEDFEGEACPIIQPGDSIRSFFEENIFIEDHSVESAKTSTKEEKRVKANYLYLFNKLSTRVNGIPNNSEKLEFLKSLRNKISDLIVIHIKIESEEEAYEIFETTNARGVDLSIADLLKNLIFKNIPAEDGRDAAKKTWEEIELNIQATNIEMKKFIRYFWISKYEFVPEKKLFKEIKQKVTKWEDLLNEILTTSICFNRLLEGSEEDWSDIKYGDKIYSSVQAIRVMGVSQCYVLFMSILNNIDRLETNPTRIFSLIEKFTFLYSSICKLPTNKLEKLYSKYATRLQYVVNEYSDDAEMRGKEVQTVFNSIVLEIKKEVPSSEVFKEKFADVAYKNSEKSRKLIKYILAEIDRDLKVTAEEKIDFKQVNIEHVLPQKPSEEWKVSSKDISTYVNLLGNLTIVDKRINSRIGNRDIKTKIESLSDSSLPITKELVETIKESDYYWGEDQIKLRHEKLARIAYDKVWRIA